ncbi:MAG: polysaccharide biosynthesis protein [Verrucomicrobiaceae bacterium]|nr:polysaccharide biosynthesis protein [Verrucomicrobiaceae bacterium]
MILGLKQFLSERTYLRRLGASAWHLVGVILCYLVAFGLRFDFIFSDKATGPLLETLPFAVAVFLGVVLSFRLYAGLWTYFSYRDCLKYLVSMGFGTLLLGLVIFLERGFSFHGYPRSVLPIYLMVLLVWEIGGRMVVRFLRESWNDGPRPANGGRVTKKALLIGAPDEVDSVLRTMGRRSEDLGEVVGLVTAARRHATIRGVQVLGGFADLEEIVRGERPDTVVILPPHEKPLQIKQVIDCCSAEGLSCHYRIVPSVREIAGGQLSVSAIRDVQIEDLLARPEVKFDRELLTSFVTGAHVMVTGAGGSIGSELCRQVLSLAPKKLVLFEQCEFALFEIDRELRSRFPDLEIVAIMGDICEPSDVEHAINSSGGIDLIYHAAAYKHVHLMELNTSAAMRNNVFGSICLANTAEACGVKRFVMISTDKAVNPTSMMGCSKRLAERALLERPKNGMRILAVRFGNVLGSSGSVIPIFQKQIAAGGPVTVTTKETRRYFMTIPEAVQLVMMSGAVGDDRQVMVLEMGEPIKIWNLAKRMIELSGLIPDKDIQIVFTGLRPGEKEYEELLTGDEDVVATDREQIAVFAKKDWSLPALDLSGLRCLVQSYNETGLREFCREAIPEHMLESQGENEKLSAADSCVDVVQVRTEETPVAVPAASR